MSTGDDGHWGPGIVGLLAALLALVIIVTVLRVTTRIYIVHAFWWDDLTMILAVLGTTIGAALGFLEVHYGFGKREQYLTPYQLREFQKYTYGEWIQTFFTLMWTKVSICLFLIRIPHSKRLRRPLEWAVAFLILSNTILTVMWIMQCQPIRAAWDDSGDGGCLSHEGKEGIILAQAIISLVSDFAFAAFPILLLWRIQIDLKTKVGLWLLMCLGFITGACCLVRTVINDQALPLDESYDGIVNWVWRTFEVQVGIIAGCIPTLRPLYMWLNGTRHPEDREFGSNVKYKLSATPQAWVENARNPHSWAKSPTRDPEKGNVRGKKIVEKSPVRPQSGALHGPNIQERRGEDHISSIGDDMARYGIKNSPSWDSDMKPDVEPGHSGRV